jgi:hypothetical protein
LPEGVIANTGANKPDEGVNALYARDEHDNGAADNDRASLLMKECPTDMESGLGLIEKHSGMRDRAMSPGSQHGGVLKSSVGINRSLNSGVINAGEEEFKLCTTCLTDKSLASAHCSV